MRTLIVMPGYVIDLLEWVADRTVTVDLPLHADVELGDAEPLRAGALVGGTGTEDGFAFADAAAVQRVSGGRMVHGVATSARMNSLHVWSTCDVEAEWWRATAPGPPGGGPRRFRVVRSRGAAGALRTMLDWSGAVASVELGDAVRVMLHDGTMHVHRRAEHGWTIELLAGTARSSIDLVGVVERAMTTNADGAAHDVTRDQSDARTPIGVPSSPAAVGLELGESHYRRSEQTWREAGQPTAVVEISSRPGRVTLVITVERSDLTFASADAINPYDNELPDVNGDGVQLYVHGEDGLACWMLVPEIGSERVRVRTIEGGSLERSLVARWARVDRGYRLFVELPGPRPTALDVLINEMPRSRERRRGQLVLSGAAGEFVYLRGDRHDPDRLLPLRYEDD